MRLRYTARVVAAVVLFATCGAADDSVEARPEAPLRTDSSAYSLAWDGRGWATTIGFEYRNTTPDTVYVLNCNQHVTLNVEKRDSTGWKDFWYGATNGCMSPPIVIAPGDTYRDELPIWGAPAGTTTTTAFLSDNFAGTYRLKWNQLVLHYTGHGRQLGDTLPEHMRVSNSFTFRRHGP